MLLETGGHRLWTPASGSWHLFTCEILVQSLQENEVMILRLGRHRPCCRLSETLGCMASCWFSLL